MKLEPKKLGYIEGWLSTAVNIVLFGLKYWIGVKADSVAMKADAWHTLSDMLTSVVVIVGFWIATKKPDEKHPFGHGRAESIGAVIIGTLLFVVGATFFKESIERLIHRQGVQFSTFAIIIFFISVLIKEGMASFAIWAGKKIDSRSLIADGWHHRSDAVASGLIVIGALLGRYFWWIDGVAGILVSLLIFYATYDILKHSMSTLLGERHQDNLKGKLVDLVNRHSSLVTDIHHLHIHKYGDNVELTFHIYLPETIVLREAHEIASRLEDAIRDEMNIEATIHYDPIIEE